MRPHVHGAQPGGTCLPRPSLGGGRTERSYLPLEGPVWLGWVARWNPLTVRRSALAVDICVGGARQVLAGAGPVAGLVPSPAHSTGNLRQPRPSPSPPRGQQQGGQATHLEAMGIGPRGPPNRHRGTRCVPGAADGPSPPGKAPGRKAGGPERLSGRFRAPAGQGGGPPDTGWRRTHSPGCGRRELEQLEGAGHSAAS